MVILQQAYTNSVPDQQSLYPSLKTLPCILYQACAACRVHAGMRARGGQ